MAKDDQGEKTTGRLPRLKMPLDVDEALRDAMKVPPPTGDKAQDDESDDQNDTPDDDRKQS